MKGQLFSWILATLGVAAMALLAQGERGLIIDCVLAVIAGTCSVAPLAWYVVKEVGDSNDTSPAR